MGADNHLYRLTFVKLLAALVLALAATLYGINGIAIAADPTGSISGTVLEDDGVTPVAGAAVFVNNFTTGAAVANATSTPSGTYTVTGLDTGTYRVHANAKDQGFPVEYYDDTSNPKNATAVSVTDGVDTPNIDFSLFSGGTISGTVYQEDGVTPIVDADVWAESYDCCEGGNGTRTAGDGTYSITGLPVGDYRVQGSASEQGFAHEYYDDTADWSLAARVTVSSSSTVASIDFTLGTGGSISGTVTQDGDSSPVANADVWANLYDGGGGNGTQTAGDGTYTITGLPAGDYRVEVRGDSQSLSNEFYNDTTDWSLAARVTVSASSTTPGIDFGLASGGSVSGTVTRDSDASPVADAWVWAETYDCCGGNGTQTGTDGTYTIAGLMPGDYRIGVHSPEDGLAGEFYNDTTDWSLAARVTVSASSTVSSIDFGLASGGSISGTVVRDSDASPVADAWVWAENYDCCGGGNGAQTASDGTYTITGLTPGNYRVQVHVDAAGLAGEFYNDKSDWLLADSVTVTGGSTTSNVDFSLSSGGSISGTVYQSDGVTPVANADVWADKYDCCGGGNGSRTASDGTYTISGLAPGDYRVQVFAQGQALAGQFYNGTTDWSLADRVTVTSSQTTSDIDFQLDAGGSISGTVYQSDGVTPVANADVWADKYDCCGGGNGTRTSSNGTYTITGLAPGDYRVQVQVPNKGLAGQFYNGTTDWDKAAKVTVTASQTTSGIDFQLDAGGSISGTVYQSDGVTPVANVDVWANTYDCCGGGNGSRTASDGTYTISGLAPGDYRVEVFAQGQDLAGEFYNDTTDWFLADKVTVTAGQTTASIDFSLDAGGSISGTVTRDGDSSPIANAWVWAETFDCCGGNGAQTDSGGNYTITGLAPGDYRVHVYSETGSLAGEFYNDTTDWGLATKVTVAEGQTTSSIDFGLAAGGSISGTVTKDSDGSPVANADVWANSYQCCGGGGTRTSSNGTYTISGLPAGEYRVEVYPDPSGGQGLAGEFYNDQSSWDDANTVTVVSSQDTSNIDFGLASGGSISGTVYQGDGVTPVPGANVWANSYDSNGGHGWARTDSNGAYTMTGLAPGNYRVEAEAQGLVHKLYDNTTQWDLASPVAVTASQDTPGIDFTLDSGGIITGTVYLGDGVTPVAGAEINAGSYDGNGGWGWAQSASDGTFTIKGLASGDYRVQAGAPQQGLTYQFYDGVTDWNSADRVTVTSGATTPDIDFTLGTGGSISGTVYLEDGVTPVANAWVWAETHDCCSGGNGSSTDSNGNYTIEGLAAGDYRVQVNAPEQGLVSEFYDDTSDWGQADEVTVVASQDTSGIDFALGGGGSISGTVYLEDGVTPVINAWVHAETFDCCGGNGAQTDSNGNYTVSGLAPGDYRVQVNAPEQGLTFEIYDNTTDWGAAERVTVTSGQATSGIDFTLGAGGSISGTVLLDDGVTPVANAWVWADTYDCCSGGNGANTDNNGNYTISGLASGDYRVQVNAPEQGLINEFYDGTSDWSEAERVTVASGQTTSEIDFTLGAGGSIAGTVLKDSDGSPVANAWVWAESYNCCGGNGAQTNSDGTYTITGLAPGDYRVGVHVDASGLAGEFYDDADWEGADKVTVTTGATTAGIDFSLAAGGSISGVVLRASDGSPVAGAEVWAGSVACCGGGDTRSNPDGTYTITGLAAGDYRVHASAPMQGLAGEFYNNVFTWEQGTTITVVAGQDIPNIDFSLSEGASIFGTVYQADGVTPIAGAEVFAYLAEDDEEEFQAFTESDGTYEIIGLAPGNYFVEAEADGFTLEIYPGVSDFDSATEVAVSAATDVAGINFSLDVGGSISGIVTEDDGVTPLSFVEVAAIPAGSTTMPDEIFFDEETEMDGTYTLVGLPPGDYIVFAIGAEAGFVFEFYGGTTDPQSATVVAVTGGQDTSDIDFALPEGGSISGRVYESDGVTPIIDILVIAEEVTTGIMMGETETEPDGSYSIEGLPAGQYRVYTEDDLGLGFVDEYYNNVTDEGSATPVTVTVPNDTPDIDFNLDAE